MENNENINVEQIETFDWDDELSGQDPVSEKRIVLEEGDYNFLVTKFERGRFPGSDKLPAAHKATIQIQINSKEGLVNYGFDILLIKLEGFEKRLYGFFRSIGQKEVGQSYKMDWNKVLGSKGRAHFRPKNITGKNGDLVTVNDLVYFIDYDANNFTEQDDLPF